MFSVQDSEGAHAGAPLHASGKRVYILRRGGPVCPLRFEIEIGIGVGTRTGGHRGPPAYLSTSFSFQIS